MSKAVVASSGAPIGEVVELKDPVIAAILAWLVPGLGHLYQGRIAKGVLFAVCLLSTFFFGLWLGDGKVVYATRLQYLCQVGTGLPALPAVWQAYLTNRGNPPMWNGVMAPPANIGELNDWYRSLNRYFELGTVYTMIAGLLNVLVIFDAFAGPVPPEPEPEKARKDDADASNG